MKAIKYIGMDLGSSYSYVVLSDGNEFADFVISALDELPIDDKIEDCGCATRLYEKNGEKFLLSASEALRRKYKVIDRIKEECINANSTDESKLNMEIYLSLLFDELLYEKSDDGKKVKRYDLSELETVCVGFPKLEQYRKYPLTIEKILKKILDKLSAEKKIATKSEGVSIKINSEPYLSACAYIYEQLKQNNNNLRIKDDDIILVVDAGGATLDVALVQVSKDLNGKIRLMNKAQFNAASDLTPGKRVNEVIMSHLLHKGLIPEGAQNDFAYKYEVETVKRKLFNKNQTPVTSGFMPNGKQFQLRYEYLPEDKRLKQDEKDLIVYLRDNTGIEPELTFDTYMSGCARTVRNFIPQDIEISMVIFTGGCSKMKPLREHIMRALEDIEHGKNLLLPGYKEFVLNKKLGNLHSANAVAYGACLYAADKTDFILEAYMGDNRRRAENRYFKGRDDFEKYKIAYSHMFLDSEKANGGRLTFPGGYGIVVRENEEIDKLKSVAEKQGDYLMQAVYYGLREQWQTAVTCFYNYKTSNKFYARKYGVYFEQNGVIKDDLDEIDMENLRTDAEDMPDALIILGQCRLFGRNEEKNLVKAVEDFKKAKSKTPDAFFWIARCEAEKGTTSNIVFIDSLLYELAVKTGHKL